MTSTADAVIDDLHDESEGLDALVASLAEQGWAQATPAPGWTIAHQIAHLHWTDAQSLLAVTDPEGFANELPKALADPLGFVDKAAEEVAQTPPAELLLRWRDTRNQLHAALRDVPDGVKIPWYGPPMSAASMGTARLMETWAHALDVADALGATPAPTARLKSIAHLGVRTRDYAFSVHGQPAPADPFRVELTGPDGQTWAWGPQDAAQRVTGSALDFCYLVTQRRPRGELDLQVTGADAEKWLSLAQAFAGPPGSGRG
ncbi:TIGR03084 family protein [Mycobacterium sp. CBMA271]|uniref:TIGR03084 family metal-binding protein n=1 Tax=unclassified Mycobacteroides TaxID=2618759 RepID=UPI0013259722|nr:MULTISPECIES: TIGR03084 family metal-binding protein [unclassified Mycobacteroides]MUM17087.1 TIGR03084 family protein [Mycobacteroides sp. CBMA 326]MUM23325.1 TIGR03084 family protein [Mycobacteroides sp. CBMA 271]